MECIGGLLTDVEVSASRMETLYARVKLQKGVILEDAKGTLHRTISRVEKTLDDRQQTISRSIASNVRERLTPGYSLAAKESGKGMFARQKVLLVHHCYCTHS